VRARAGDHNLTPNRIGAFGFSAAGHLAATTGTLNQRQPYAVASIVESVTNISTNTCGTGAPLTASQCVAPSVGLGPSGNGQFLIKWTLVQTFADQGYHNPADVDSHRPVRSLCGALNAPFGQSPRVTHSNSIKVNGSTTPFAPGRILY
jgi:acetyl esterase/lipase